MNNTHEQALKKALNDLYALVSELPCEIPDSKYGVIANAASLLSAVNAEPTIEPRKPSDMGEGYTDPDCPFDTCDQEHCLCVNKPSLIRDIEQVGGALELCEPEDQSAFENIKSFISKAIAQPAAQYRATSAMRSALYAIANTLDDGELRNAAKEAYEASYLQPAAQTKEPVQAAQEVTDSQIVEAVHKVHATGRVALTVTSESGEETPTNIARCLVSALLSSKPSNDAADAARYRWIRNAENGGALSVGKYIDTHDEYPAYERVDWLYGDDLDAEVDREMKSLPQGEEK